MYIRKKICASAAVLFLILSAAGCSSSGEIILEEIQSSDEGSVSQEETLSAEEETDTGTDVTEDSASSDEDAIVVYICGEVKNPGVYTLRAGARVCDAVEMAGGLTEDADEAAVNQAEILSDEQMVYIYSLDENAETAAEGSAGSASSGGSSEEDSGKVNINTADLTELTTLTGIGEAKAQSIITYREENGDFSSIEEIMNVSGIKEGTYAQIKDDICV